MSVISMAIQKGGQGKSITTIHLGAYLALQGKKVLIIDFDPQANTTSVLTVEDISPFSLKNTIIDKQPVSEIIIKSNIENLDIIPSNISLAKLERHLVTEINGSFKLRKIIRDNMLHEKYDVVLIDTPPSLGMLTINALVASDFVLIPFECTKFSIDGVQDLYDTITPVREDMNPELRILGAFVNKFDSRQIIKKDFKSDMDEFFGELLFSTKVRQNVRIEEACAMKKPIFLYDRKAIGTLDFEKLCKEIVDRLNTHERTRKNKNG